MDVTLNADPLIKALGNVVTNLPKELRIVSWKTAKKTKSIIAKDVVKELAVTQKIVRAQLVEKRVGKTGSSVTVKKSRRIPLRDYKARQTKAGISYKISKSKGRKTIPNAFKGPRPGLTFARFQGHVFGRMTNERKPIKILYGPSPWGVFAKSQMRVQTKPKIKNELRKQLAERVRFKTLKKQGVI